MPGLSIHVVDVSRGRVASGMQVEVLHAGRRIAGGAASEKGVFEVDSRLERGVYEAVLHAGAWYRRENVPLPAVPFLDLVSYRFGIDDPEQHYHLPIKLTPWGLSCFRGGA